MERELLNKITKAHKSLVRAEDNFWNHIQYCEKCSEVTGLMATEPKAHDLCETGRALNATWIAFGNKLDKVAGIN